MASVAKIAASYDAVALKYADELSGELETKPIDRAMLGAFGELADASAPHAVLADVGCGPGHVAAYLSDLGLTVVGIDLSPVMIDVARERYPDVAFAVGSLLDLPVRDGGWSGVVCAYSIIHLTEEERGLAFTEIFRAVNPGGWLLLSFHVSTEETPVGGVLHFDEWWGHEVDLDFHYLSAAQVSRELHAAGFVVMSVTERHAWPEVEHPSRRCHMLAFRP